ncbi:MAG TPA: hypothetical protein DCQ04_04900 [Actinobacteria bacterium]|nr:hypothetical protein [Actinomycetota bacterium]
MSNHDAYFDALSICDRLQPILGQVATSEVHLIAYLSCLLALYRGRAVGNWGYKFAVTKEGYPYSPDVQAAVDTLLHQGVLVADADSFLMVTRSGTEELALLRSLGAFRERDEYINGACGSTLALPTGTIRDAVAHAPDVRGALRMGQTRLLLTQSGQNLLYDQFAALSQAVGIDVADLMVPAVVWLIYLLEASADGPAPTHAPAHAGEA